MTQETRPLDGLRVLDLSRAVSGPFAGRILADLGADVVRAELPGTDVTQAFGKVIRGRSGLYSHVNAGKRSIVLDLQQPGDVTRLLDLAAACDVVVENFRPGVLDRFGAGWAALSAVNPRLVMLSISGFGREGEDAGRAAYAPVIHAEAGLIGRQADITGDPPADIAFAVADALAGLHGTIAILAALRLRDRTRTGQHIDLSMLEAMLATDDYTAPPPHATPPHAMSRPEPRPPRATPRPAPRNAPPYATPRSTPCPAPRNAPPHAMSLRCPAPRNAPPRAPPHTMKPPALPLESHQPLAAQEPSLLCLRQP
jgi:crotonobetainyl-CoA:carnitine CoA-transferase CaiB-like acyl-CoA transferase